MKKFITLLAMTLTFAGFTSTPVDARDHHRHHSHSNRHYHHSGHRHHTSRHHHHASRHHHHVYAPYYGYQAPVYRQQVMIGYDRYGYPIYGYRNYDQGYYPRSRGYLSLPGIRIGF